VIFAYQVAALVDGGEGAYSRRGGQLGGGVGDLRSPDKEEEEHGTPAGCVQQ
jgi:hypothetical protein